MGKHCLVFWVAASAYAAGVDFSRDIQPVLERQCYGCHGPKQQMGSLRLDKDARSLPAQTILDRVTTAAPAKRMPMGGKALDAAVIEQIRQWAAQKPVHWAFVAPKKPAGAAGIDGLVRARLTQEGLKPSPEADRVTLLRRLSLDLIGLPPTISEVDAFVRDKSPRAYQKQVDRLLASPHYGERWGRHWLDAARYADSDGYEKDKMRQVWFYRDWVINSLNRDLPYNQFLVEQLAGDLLPNATQDQIVATGFLRNSMINEEGGVDPEQFRMEAMFDRMDAIGKGMLGLTIGCAQCHNHKFDPLKQEEYYRLFAFLNNSYEGSAAVYTPAEQQTRARIFGAMREIEDGLKHRMPDWKARLAAWEAAQAAKQPEWTVVKLDVDDISSGGQRYLQMPDSSLLAQGYAPTKHSVKLTVKTELKEIAALRLELMKDANLPMGGPGRSTLGTGSLSEFEAEVGGKKIKFVRALADISLPEAPLDAMYNDKGKKARVTGPVEYAIDGKDETAWGWDAGPGRRNQPHEAWFIPEQPIRLGEGQSLIVYLSQKHGGWNSDDNQNCNLGRMRLSVTGAIRGDAAPVLKGFAAWRGANEKIEALWRQHPEGTSQLVLRQQPEMRETHILTRGDFLQPAKAVTPGVPAFLNPLPAGADNSRLTLARWMTDRNAPTTARALVNRVWQQYFGTGLVATSEDLGTQCEPPTHPELLDWLAVEFMERGWSLKALQRTIVNSTTYKQSSRVSPELLSKDPYNRLLARGPRQRVEAEIVRDIALAASGLLNNKVGGPSVYPPAPEFLFQPPVSYGPKNWYTSKDGERFRRAIYTFRYRSVPYPVLQTFDAPNGDSACVRRSRSNTPLQALATLNEPLFVEAAKALGERVLKEGGADDAARIDYAFRLCVARAPEAAERAELTAFLGRQRARDPQAAWTALARVILNLDETITKE